MRDIDIMVALATLVHAEHDDAQAADLPLAKEGRKIKDVGRSLVTECPVCKAGFRHHVKDLDVQCPHCEAFLALDAPARPTPQRKPEKDAATKPKRGAIATHVEIPLEEEEIELTSEEVTTPTTPQLSEKEKKRLEKEAAKEEKRLEKERHKAEKAAAKERQAQPPAVVAEEIVLEEPLVVEDEVMFDVTEADEEDVLDIEPEEEVLVDEIAEPEAAFVPDDAEEDIALAPEEEPIALDLEPEEEPLATPIFADEDDLGVDLETSDDEADQEPVLTSPPPLAGAPVLEPLAEDDDLEALPSFMVTAEAVEEDWPAEDGIEVPKKRLFGRGRK